VTPEKEEGEPETVGEDTPLRIKAGTYASFHRYFGSMKYMYLVCA
jgi:hypothetical protein